MARFSGCLLLAALVGASSLTAAVAEAQPSAGPPSAAPPAPAPPAPKPDDKAAPPAPPAKPDDKAAPPTPPAPPAPPTPPDPLAGACTRKRAEADLRTKATRSRPTSSQIDAELLRCFRARVAECQLALDADVDEGLACWKQAPWPEVPASIKPDEIATTGTCLVELKAVIADLRACRTKKPAARDACVTPYIGYTPQCGLLKADRVWRMFPGREDVERVAQEDAKRKAEEDAKQAKLKAEQDAKEAKLKAERDAKEAKLKAEQEAKLAKETARCLGRTALDFAEKLKAAPGQRAIPGCKYQVSGRVLGKSNDLVQVAGLDGMVAAFLLRTQEPLADGDTLADRTATFDKLEEITLADGAKHSLAVFKLEPVPAPQPKQQPQPPPQPAPQPPPQPAPQPPPQPAPQPPPQPAQPKP